MKSWEQILLNPDDYYDFPPNNNLKRMAWERYDNETRISPSGTFSQSALGQLWVQFLDGSVYIYPLVPYKKFLGLRKASNPAKWFERWGAPAHTRGGIKFGYNYKNVRPPLHKRFSDDYIARRRLGIKKGTKR